MLKKPGKIKGGRKGKRGSGDLVAVTDLVPARRRDSLLAWFEVYMEVDGKAGADKTVLAKADDLRRFAQFFFEATGGDNIDQWTRSVSGDFVKYLARTPSPRTGKPLAPATINRVLATLRTAARWIHKQRPFLAGWPLQGIEDIDEDDPEWQGFSAIEVTRLKSAAEQLIHLKKRSSQRPYRNYAILMVLLYTGLRQFELRGLNLDQWQGKHLVNIRRKGKRVTRKLLVPKPAREALREYLKQERGKEPGLLIQSRTGQYLSAQDLDAALKQIARQANASLPAEQHIHLAAHKLRHTALKQAADKYDVRFAFELSGHTSPHYIWRYTGLTQAERDEMMERLH